MENTEEDLSWAMSLGSVEELATIYREAPWWMKPWLRRRARQKADMLYTIHPDRALEVSNAVRSLAKVTGFMDL